MKTIHLSINSTLAAVLLAFLLFCAGLCRGQTPSPTGTNQLNSSDYVCTQRGPHSKVWQRTLLRTNATGFVTTNQQSYTELATGICYLTNGQYVDSVEEVDPIPGGAQAIQGRHKVQWALNANTPGGAVTVTTPDGKQLSSTVFGLAYYDVASGSNVAIAQLKNCNGAIVAANQVIYADAFSNVTADVLYTYTKAGLSQDIVLRQAPPAPDTYGLSDDSTILQVYTAFINPPPPATTAVTNGNVSDDQVLDFGDMKMGMGQAFFLNAQNTSVPAGLVTKQWVQINNGTYLIESIPYQSISNQLQQLPHASNLNPNRASIKHLAFLESNPSRPGGTAKGTEMMKLAKAETAKPRLKVDYDLLSSTNNLTLQGDTTYFVTGTVNITGTTTIEGGTVVKYTNLSTAEITATAFACQTAAYRPGVFTSMYDNSVGSPISDSTNAPSQGTAYYLNCGNVGLSSSVLLSNLRFSYAGVAISATVTSLGDNWITIWDCQFFNCGSAFYGDVSFEEDGYGGFPIEAYNVLLAQCGYGFQVYNTSGYVDIDAENVTADQIATLLSADNYCSATNCIFTSVTNQSAYPLVNCCINASSSGIYQPVGGGSYYLANGSSNQGVGTTSINSALLSDLQTLTTYPPMVTNGTISNNYTFSPQVLRNNTGLPDRGYHYDPIDWALNIEVVNATITVLPGTALAGCGPEYGVWLYNNGIFNCAGTATSPNYLVQYNTVQEQSNTNWESPDWVALFLTPEATDNSSGNFAFTDWSVLADASQIAGLEIACPLALQNCQLYTGTISGAGPVISATNCLFQRANFQVTDRSVGNISQTFYNNLFWEGVLLVMHGTNVMTLIMLTNAPGTSNVGRFNYMSIYPYLPTPTVGSGSTNVALSAGTNYATASNNAVAIQTAVNNLGSAGGTVWITNVGNYMIAQANPNEGNDANQNAAVSITNSNVQIGGAGRTNTTLIAYNRATTVFSFGKDASGHNPQCSNFTLCDMTIEGQPHEAVTNTNSVVYVPGQFVPPTIDTNILEDTGALTILYAPNYAFAYNILVTNCQFLDDDRLIVVAGDCDVSNVMVRACNFIPVGGLDTWGYTNTYSGQFDIYLYEVGIEARSGGDYYNIVVIDNTYNGNSQISITNTNTAAPVTLGDFLNKTNSSQWLAADGLVYLQEVGNAFIARNFITNNQLEAINLYAGCASVVGNTFYTVVNDPSCCALAGGISSAGLPGANALDNSFTFVGNSVYGDRQGLRAGENQFPTTVNFSGNWLNLSPIIPGFANETGPGAAVGIKLYQSANIVGNELVAGGLGLQFQSGNTNVLVMNNNFAGATHGAIGYLSIGDFISTAQIFSNVLGEGVTFHVQLPYTNSFGWFVSSNNVCVTNISSVVPLFTDPASSAMHIFN